MSAQIVVALKCKWAACSDLMKLTDKPWNLIMTFWGRNTFKWGSVASCLTPNQLNKGTPVNLAFTGASVVVLQKKYFWNAIFSLSYVLQTGLKIALKVFPAYAPCFLTHPVLLHRSVPEWTAFTGPWLVVAECRTLGFNVKLSLFSILLARFKLVSCGERRKRQQMIQLKLKREVTST